MHENLIRSEDLKAGSDRAFGFVFAAFCSLVAGYMLWHSRLAFWSWIGGAAVFTLLASFAPRVLRPLNVVWFKFGLLLHHIVNPLVLGLMFFTVFTPMGWLMRLAGKRPLSLRFDKDSGSYWVERKPPGPPPGSFNNQF